MPIPRSTDDVELSPSERDRTPRTPPVLIPGGDSTQPPTGPGRPRDITPNGGRRPGTPGGRRRVPGRPPGRPPRPGSPGRPGGGTGQQQQQGRAGLLARIARALRNSAARRREAAEARRTATRTRRG